MAADDEALTTSTEPKKGGWVTIPFIIGAKVAVGVAAYGLSSNLTVYLIEQFNIPRIEATQISSIVSGSSSLAPVVGVIVADAGPGCFNVIWAATAASFLGMLLFTMISTVPSLRPPPCSIDEMCQGPSIWQLVVLYTATTLILAGLGGTRYISATFSASQLDSTSEQATFFNWYAMSLYGSALIGLTVIIYVQVGLSWTLGFALCALLSALGLVVFLLGARHYRYPKPQKNPFLTMLYALVQISRRMVESSDTLCYYERLDDGSSNESEVPVTCPSSTDSIETKIICASSTDDDFSPLVRLIPLMSTSILLYISISMVTSLTVLQALVMDRELGPNFTIPASSMAVFTFISSILFIPLLAYVVSPVWYRLARQQITPFQRMGLGHLFAVLALVTAALIELRRREALSRSGEAMSVLWLVPGLVLVGLGEALHFPSQLAFYYQELPDSLSNLATGVVALLFSIGFFTTTGVIALVRRITPWLQDDTNRSRLDNVYWMLAVMVTLNFCYFLLFVKLYKRKVIEA